MKSFVLASATLILTASLVFGDDPCNKHGLRPDGQTNCLLRIESGILKASMDDVFAQNSAKIEAARRRYFALWPNGPGIDQAEEDFLRALRQKDAYYLSLSTSTVLNSVFVKAGNALAILGGDTSLNDLNKVPNNMDGGIRPYAKPLFARWVAAMRRAEDKKPSSGSAIVDGAQNLVQFAAKMLNDPSLNPNLLVDTLQDESNWRKAYENARNWSELMSSGLNLSKFVTPEVYIRSQMEADVIWSLGQNKRDDIPDPVKATKSFYDLLVKMFGQTEVLAAAKATLLAPKNSVGGLATRAPVEIGEFVMSPSPNPYYLFLSQVTKSSPKAYAIALAFDPTVLLTMQPAAAFNTEDNWQKAFSVYTQLEAKYGKTNVLNAAGRLRDTPKDSEGHIAGDQTSQPLRVWFQALLKDSNAVIPNGQVAHFLAGSYDPRWLGKPLIVRGTVAGVDVDTHGFPQYATIRFKESRSNGFVGFSPYPDMLQSSYGDNFAGLIGKTIEVQGDVQSFGQNAGVRILSMRQLKVLDAGALANFRESTPDWMKGPAPVENLVDSPKYLSWKKFPPGTKASYQHDLLREYKPGTNQYTKTLISRFTFKLESIDNEKAVVALETTVSGKTAGRNGPDTSSVDRQILNAKQAPAAARVNDPSRIITNGEEVLVINGKSIPTRWECNTKADDPLTFTKTWTSDEVPGGLVRIQEQTHTQITNETYRTISQTLYAPLDGVEPKLGDGATPAPSAAGGPARAPVAPQAAAPGPVPASNPAATSAAAQMEFSKHYSAVMVRAAQVRAALARAQINASAGGVPLPEDIRAAPQVLTSRQQALNVPMRTRDYVAAEQILSSMEDELSRVEDYLAKAGIPASGRNPARR